MSISNSKTFDVSDPKRHVTDPQGLGDVARSAGGKTLYRAATEETPTTLIVDWQGRTPIYNEVTVAATKADVARLVADGWSDTGPVLGSDETAPTVGRRRQHAAA